ncbi:hypothetical protein C1645_829272 [Glomus cerebriforme]|uniref:Uncharacterized protein n=1 Tax=Glomus cerebriforme TaxID=658196 RepID=A0A397SLC4_9GLOM|nr:hypothetical protein C1645_829272 [Glomus cerebriforme]
MDNNILKLKVDSLLLYKDFSNCCSDDNWHTCENKMVFSETFTNLPNLHVNVYLLQHTRNFATLTNTAIDPNIYKILTSWYAIENLSSIINKEFEEHVNNNITICYYDNNFVDIILINQQNAKKINEMGLSKKLDDKHPFF